MVETQLVAANNGTAAFAYDAVGRRASKSLLSASTSYVYDGANSVQEQSSGAVTANMLSGGVDEYFQRADATGTYFYLTDALGSTVAMSDSSGAVQTTYSYGPYGMLSATGSNTNPYTYTGRESDGLGLDYYRARYYNPQTGRFLSEDPLGFAGSGTNFYAYSYDSPFVFVDPYGLTVSCTYTQNTGNLVCYDVNTGNQVVNTSGYAGGNEGLNPEGVNNSSYQPTSDIGPLPVGGYNIGLDNGRMGSLSLPLTPWHGNSMYGRGGFYIHGDNHSKPPMSASKGCIVTDNKARRTINDSGGGTLYVMDSDSPNTMGVCVGGFCSL